MNCPGVPLFRILRRTARREFLVSAVVLVALVASGCATGRHATSGSAIRVMTWNIHHAEGTDHTIDVDRIARVILSEKPDIVALQEVDRGVERSKKIDIITALADRTDMTYAFGKTIDYQGGDYGNAFLTRFPILEERNLHYKMIREGEQRGLLQLILDVRGEELVVANTHLDSRGDDSARVPSIEELKATLSRYSPRPVIVCGDMNDDPNSPAMTQLKKDYDDSWEQAGRGEGFTYPSDEPKKRIDYIFILKNPNPERASAGVRLRPVSARTLKSSASDHLPLLVEFELSTER